MLKEKYLLICNAMKQIYWIKLTSDHIEYTNINMRIRTGGATFKLAAQEHKLKVLCTNNCLQEDIYQF